MGGLGQRILDTLNLCTLSGCHVSLAILDEIRDFSACTFCIFILTFNEGNEVKRETVTAAFLIRLIKAGSVRINVDRREATGLVLALGGQLSQTVMNNYHCNGVVL